MVLTATLFSTAAMATPLGIYVNLGKEAKVSDVVEVNLSGDLPAQPVDIYLYVINSNTGSQSFYYEKKIHDPKDPVRPWRAGISGPKLPETNPIFSFRVSQPGTYRVGVKAQAAAKSFSQDGVQEASFIVQQGNLAQPVGTITSNLASNAGASDKKLTTLVLGRDDDGDGLWDDLKPYLEKSYGSQKQRAQAEALFKSFQDVLLMLGKKNDQITLVLNKHRVAHRCFFSAYGDQSSAQKDYRGLIEAFFAPDDRSTALVAFHFTIGVTIFFPNGVSESIKCNSTP
jgi:hypothetical protein